MEKMTQDYAKYTSEDTAVWNTLFERQLKNLPGKAHPEYLHCLDQLSEVLNPNKIPDFSELNEKLMAENGWSIVVVPGLIPVDDFFKLLSEKKFCSSTWLRQMSQLDYLEEPDMFHDIFGHIPLLMNSEYARFVQKFGEMGVKYGYDKTVEKQLQRLYWFTIEFGLIKQQNLTRIYGAGILSSSGESNHIYDDDITVLPYDVEKILDNDFITSEIQTQYYEIETYEQLFESVGELEENLMEEVKVV
ncbi:phenylalanine 4-monooxygenase [Rhodohalobacter sp. 8-1]|uniref:phenylalanine 4-monooxygenase n=1 Tax=Rhodohalobacter sp. 8-1 TaxID=3131972 RepID=UPI0030EB6B55